MTISNILSGIGTRFKGLDPEVQGSLASGAMGLFGNALGIGDNKEEELLKALGSIDTTQGLKGLQSGFTIPGMQSVNGLLGKSY